MKTNSFPWLGVFLSLAISSGSWGGEARESAAKAPGRVTSVGKEYPVFGEIERLDPALDRLVAPGAPIEKLAGGFDWAEGPVWNPKAKTLLFSDVPRNVVFEWKQGVGTREILLPSGYTGSGVRGGESGSNGLALDRQGRLVLCQHGDRRVARYEGAGRFTTLARHYKDRRFNSPNDLVFHSNGDLYFTDPPYGLEKGDQDPAKELLFSGVYLLRARTGEVVLLAGDLRFPNGIELSPDQKTLFVAISDPSNPVVMAYDLQVDGTASNGRVFFDARTLAADRKGLPDGLKVDQRGNVFATGPGGVLVISPAGQHLGTIRTGELIANCAWGDDGSTLYLTSDMFLARVKTLTKGRGF